MSGVPVVRESVSCKLPIPRDGGEAVLSVSRQFEEKEVVSPMRYRSRGWIALGLFLTTVLRLEAAHLKNPDFEAQGGWQIATQGRNLVAAFDDDTSHAGQKSFVVSLDGNSPTNKADFAAISQVVELTKADMGITFHVKDDYTGKTKNYHWMELLLDEEVIWEADVAGGNTGWRKVSLDLTRYLKTAKSKKIGRNTFREEKTYKLTFRVFERNGVNRFGVHVWADNFKLLKETPANPQNCEKKKVLPRLRSLLLYDDPDGLFQPISTLDHFTKKRQQILYGMSQGMGQLPDRPKHRLLDDFRVRVLNSQVRGRYIKKTIQFDVAQGEVVHAFLYEPLDRPLGVKRPGIVGMHPTSKSGKTSFESWPLGNFPIELAMLGYVVIVPDYPGFGDSKPYDFETDRYDSGTIKGVYNHMSCVDLLQVHPHVDPTKIGTIGHSLGGHNAMFLAAFDDRVKIAVSSCGWTPFEYYETKKGRLKTWALPSYMPLLETVYGLHPREFPFDFHEVAAAIAPRVFFSSSPTGDGVFPGWGPKAAATHIRKFFKLRGAEKAFQFHQPRAQHRFPWDTRQAAYRAMNDTFDYHFHGELGLLAERHREQAIPMLKKALLDTNPKVRWSAADMLVTLNDQSGMHQMKADLELFSADPKHWEHALELARVLARMGDGSGYKLAAHLAAHGTTHGQRWRAAVALAHIANIDQTTLQSAGLDPIAVLKTMAAEEQHEGVFFVFVDQMHKILKNRSDMIAIFAIAKESKHHSTPPPGNRFSIAEIFYSVAVRDQEKSWR